MYGCELKIGEHVIFGDVYVKRLDENKIQINCGTMTFFVRLNNEKGGVNNEEDG